MAHVDEQLMNCRDVFRHLEKEVDDGNCEIIVYQSKSKALLEDEGELIDIVKRISKIHDVNIEWDIPVGYSPGQ